LIVRIEFTWASEFISSRQRQDFEFIKNVANFASLARIKRTAQIMVRQKSDNLSLSQMICPCTQTTDVFLLDLETCQLAVDQRDVNIIVIE
jgi:tyrosyl-tRNA synthetase